MVAAHKRVPAVEETKQLKQVRENRYQGSNILPFLVNHKLDKQVNMQAVHSIQD